MKPSELNDTPLPTASVRDERTVDWAQAETGEAFRISGDPPTPALTLPDKAKLAELVDAEQRAQIKLSEISGMLKFADFHRKLVTVTEIKVLAELKDSGKYKGLKVLDQNEKVVTVTTWESLCKALGRSREIVDQDIANLNSLGESFFETSQRLKLGYRDLRKLRTLPEDTKKAIIQQVEVNLDDKDEIVSLIDDLAAKHAREKQDWAKERADLEKRADRSEARVNAAVEVETKALTKERDQLVRERDALAAQVEEPDWARTKAYAERMKTLAAECQREAATLLKTLPRDQEMPDALRFEIQTALYVAFTAVESTWIHWQNQQPETGHED